MQQRQVIGLQQQVAVLQVVEGNLVPIQDQQLAICEYLQLGSDVPGRDPRSPAPVAADRGHRHRVSSGNTARLA